MDIQELAEQVIDAAAVNDLEGTCYTAARDICCLISQYASAHDETDTVYACQVVAQHLQERWIV